MCGCCYFSCFVYLICVGYSAEDEEEEDNNNNNKRRCCNWSAASNARNSRVANLSAFVVVVGLLFVLFRAAFRYVVLFALVLL